MFNVFPCERSFRFSFIALFLRLLLLSLYCCPCCVLIIIVFVSIVFFHDKFCSMRSSRTTAQFDFCLVFLSKHYYFFTSNFCDVCKLWWADCLIYDKIPKRIFEWEREVNGAFGGSGAKTCSQQCISLCIFDVFSMHEHSVLSMFVRCKASRCIATDVTSVHCKNANVMATLAFQTLTIHIYIYTYRYVYGLYFDVFAASSFLSVRPDLLCFASVNCT